MKILVSGGWSYGNIGDEAIATATQYLLRQSFPGAELTFTAYDPESFAACHGFPALTSVHAHLSRFPAETLTLEAVLAQPGRFGLDEFAGQLDGDTLFVMSGGGYFTESWRSQFVARLAEMAIAKEKGAKVAVIGQSIGPVYSDGGKEALKKQLSGCDFLCVRDESTRDFLASLGLEAELAPDVANVIADIIPAQPQENLINIMPAAYSGYVSVGENKKRNKLLEKIKKRISPAGIRYKRQMRALVHTLAKEYPLQFVLSTQWDWDRKFVDYLCAGLDSSRYSVITGENTRQLCDSLSKGQYLISTKMHPIILSASYGIPAIGIAYNFKVDDYMASLGAQERCVRIDRVNARRMLDMMAASRQVDASGLKRQVYEMMARLARLCGE